MEIEKRTIGTMNNLENVDFLNNYNSYPILDISEPLMFVLNELDDYYLAYTLQNRIAVLNDDTKAEIIEMLVVKTDILKINMLLSGEVDIKDVLCHKQAWRIGKIGKKIYPKKIVDDFLKISDRIPKVGVRFNHEIPNRVNLKSTLDKIMKDWDFYSRYNLNEHIHTKPKVRYLNTLQNTNTEKNHFGWTIFDEKKLDIRIEEVK